MNTIDKIGRLIWWVITNWRKITLDKVKNFVESKHRQVLEAPYSDWVMEQYNWRYGLVKQKSPECISGGACVGCGCETPDKFFESLACEGGCYPDWMEKEDWEEFNKTLSN